MKNKKQISLNNIKKTLGSAGKFIKVYLAVFAFLSLGYAAFAQTAMVTENFVSYPSTAPSANYQCNPAVASYPTSSDTSNRSFYSQAISGANVSSVDPWVNSALIEYDAPYPSSTSGTNPYPNHCLTFCGEVTCANPVRKVQGPDSTSIFMEDSGSFPIQSVLFEIFKYQKNANPYNADSTPPIRTIALYPQDNNVCPGVVAYKNKSSDDYKSNSCCDNCWPAAGSCQYTGYCSGFGTSALCNADAACTWTTSCQPIVTCSSLTTEQACKNQDVCTWNTSGTRSVNSSPRSECASTCSNFTTSGLTALQNYNNCVAGIKKLNFCAAWDGMYEIDGEFGKSNGQFGYRTTIASKWPGDGVSTPDIDLTHTIVYPGENQIPIQVDATNVHSVRSTATIIGAKVAVTGQPYNISYRLSKDAKVTINITDPTTSAVKRALINDEPRLGEGTPGGTTSIDTVTTEVESWDGRDDNGNLLPYGNYLVSIQARSQDEWTGTSNYDISRTVTRQLSLDPLKLTDFVATGLSKTSTSYAMLSYMLTETATVYVRIYTPGTTLTNGSEMSSTAATGTTPAITGGTLVYSVDEQKAGRSTVNTKWDGFCHVAGGCTYNGVTYNENAAMPDGDYVYVIWAEMPYTSGTTIAINGKTWNGVKTRLYHNGTLAVNRGLPEITVQAVGYSTIGSSPTAFGLDPFIFRYSLSRDSYITATVKTTSESAAGGSVTGAPFTVKILLNNQVQVANQMNVFTWDGKDENGRYVSPGTYVFEVVAKDSLFPDKQVVSTVQFPVDLFRAVDVTSTPILGDATGQATINYMLSKSMDVTLSIYDKNVVIPNPNDVTVWPPVSCTSQPASGTTPSCIYYKDTSGGGTYTFPITPIKTFTGTRPGEGVGITEIWDGYDDTAARNIMSDGTYPYMLYAHSPAAASVYYNINAGTDNPIPQAAVFATGMDATDKPTGYITIARGSVEFTSIKINPSKPQLFHSSETVYIPTYEVQFAVSRTAKVKVEVISNSVGACLGATTPAGTVCRTLTTTSSSNPSGIFDPVVINKLYWDGKDEKGDYVKTDAYTISLSADPYPLPSPAPSTTYATQTLNVNNFQVFDRYIWDVTPQNSNYGKFAYQISVPMKVSIQIFKPGTKIADATTGTLVDPANPSGAAVDERHVEDVLVKAIVGVRPNLIAIEDIWDGTDYAGQKVPDGVYPYRFVTVLDSYDMNSINGSVITSGTSTVQDLVADWNRYVNLGVINVANGDSWYPDADWKDNKVTMFFPNPLRKAEGQFEITKVPAPGTVKIKIYNIAGDLIREGGYNCINARGITSTLEAINAAGGLDPDWSTTTGTTGTIVGGRNFALRCTWDRTNQNGKKVARGLYYAIMELNPTRGNAKRVQKVIKILIP